MIKLSILILTIPSRLTTYFPKIIIDIQNQISKRNDVEIIGLYDNKKRTVGQKRNELLRLAQGEYLTFIDDDDRIAPDYIDSIMNTLYTVPDIDCLCFGCETTVNGGDKHFSKYSIHFSYGRTRDQWRGKPAHTMVWKSSIAKKYTYDNKNYGEDTSWVMRAHKDIKNEVQINKILYYYDFNSGISETRR